MALVLPEIVAVILDKLQGGWDVAFVDGSRELKGGLGLGDLGVVLCREMTKMNVL